MKRKIILYLILISLVFHCKKITIKNDLQKENIKGEVKEIKKSLSIIDEYSNKLKESSIYITNYNKKGFKTSFYIYNPDMSVNSEYRFYYKNNLLTKKTWYFSSGNSGEYNYKYDKNGNLTEQTEKEDNKITKKEFFEYKYDENNNVIEEQEYSRGSNFHGKIKLTSISLYEYTFY